MPDKAVVSLTTGLEDPEKVTVALLVAVGAVEEGRAAMMFLTKEAVRLATDGTTIGTACDGQLSDREPLPDPLPLGPRIEASFLRQVREMPAAAQRLLLVAAADKTGDAAVLARAASWLGLSIDAMQEAEASGLLHVGSNVEFRHPLIRSAVYQGASSSERREANRALAAALDGEGDSDRRAWHSALASPGPDELIAAELESAALKARARGGCIAEATFLVRSADLTPDESKRVSRLLGAARAALLTANAAWGETIVSRAASLATDPLQKAQVQMLDGEVRTLQGQNLEIPALFLAAARGFADLDDDLSLEALIGSVDGFMRSYHFTTDTTGSEIAKTALQALEVRDADELLPNRQIRAAATLIASGYVEAVPALRAASLSYRNDPASAEEIYHFWGIATMAAAELWDDEAFEAIARRMENAARERGSLSALQRGLLGLAKSDLICGRYESSASRYAEVQDIAVALGGFPEFFGLLNVELLAWQGDDTTTRSTALTLSDIAGKMGLAQGLIESQIALAVLEIARGNYEDAFAAAKAAVDARAIGWSIQGYPDLIEAAVRSNKQAIAETALDEFAVMALTTGTPVALGLLARSRGLVANDDSSRSHFDESIAHLSRSVRVPEVARTQLVYGEWLRRKKQRSLAREQLNAAYELFSVIGANAFAERARRELMATGARARLRQLNTTKDLTPREYQIAQLAANRATSREIAAQLFISSNTVEYHLRKVFQKLGVSSRRQLSSVLPADLGEK